jgi:hypothetical protein
VRDAVSARQLQEADRQYTLRLAVHVSIYIPTTSPSGQTRSSGQPLAAIPRPGDTEFVVLKALIMSHHSARRRLSEEQPKPAMTSIGTYCMDRMSPVNSGTHQDRSIRIGRESPFAYVRYRTLVGLDSNHRGLAASSMALDTEPRCVTATDADAPQDRDSLPCGEPSDPRHQTDSLNIDSTMI